MNSNWIDWKSYSHIAIFLNNSGNEVNIVCPKPSLTNKQRIANLSLYPDRLASSNTIDREINGWQIWWYLTVIEHSSSTTGWSHRMAQPHKSKIKKPSTRIMVNIGTIIMYFKSKITTYWTGYSRCDIYIDCIYWRYCIYWCTCCCCRDCHCSCWSQVRLYWNVGKGIVWIVCNRVGSCVREGLNLDKAIVRQRYSRGQTARNNIRKQLNLIPFTRSQRHPERNIILGGCTSRWIILTSSRNNLQMIRKTNEFNLNNSLISARMYVNGEIDHKVVISTDASLKWQKDMVSIGISTVVIGYLGVGWVNMRIGW